MPGDRNGYITAWPVGLAWSRGTFVLMYDRTKRKGVSPKLESRWRGPYRIEQKLTEVTYRLRLGPKGKYRVVHYDLLKKYEGEVAQEWGSVATRPQTIVSVPDEERHESEPGPSNMVVGADIDQLEPEPDPDDSAPSCRDEGEVPPTRYPPRERQRPKRFRRVWRPGKIGR